MEINNSAKETYKYKGKELCIKNDGNIRNNFIIFYLRLKN